MADTPLTPTSQTRDRNRRNAQNHFTMAENRTALVKEIVAAETAASAAKTARLKALRLAKEEADRLEAAQNPQPEKKTKKKAKPAQA